MPLSSPTATTVPLVSTASLLLVEVDKFSASDRLPRMYRQGTARCLSDTNPIRCTTLTYILCTVT